MNHRERRSAQPREMVIGFPSAVPMSCPLLFGAGLGCCPFPGLSMDWQSQECGRPQQIAANHTNLGNFCNYQPPIFGYTDTNYRPSNPQFNGLQNFPFFHSNLSSMYSASTFTSGNCNDNHRRPKQLIEKIRSEERRVMSVEGLLNPCPAEIVGRELLSDFNHKYRHPVPTTKGQSRPEKPESRKRSAQDHINEANCDDEPPSKRKWKVVLTPELAVTVFRLKPRGNAKKSSSIKLSQRYNPPLRPTLAHPTAIPSPHPPLAPHPYHIILSHEYKFTGFKSCRPLTGRPPPQLRRQPEDHPRHLEQGHLGQGHPPPVGFRGRRAARRRRRQRRRRRRHNSSLSLGRR
jgi:hypothetical protein